MNLFIVRPLLITSALLSFLVFVIASAHFFSGAIASYPLIYSWVEFFGPNYHILKVVENTIFFLIFPLAIFFISFSLKSMRAGIFTFLLTLIIVTMIGSLGLLIYISDGCPNYIPNELLRSKKDLEARIKLGARQSEIDFDNERIKKLEELQGCNLRMWLGLANETRSYAGFIASLVTDYRIWFVKIFVAIISIPLSYTGALIGKSLSKKA